MLDPQSNILLLFGRNPLLWTVATVALAALTSLLLQQLAHTLQSGRFNWQRRLRAALGIEVGKRMGELSWLLIVLNFVLWSLAIYLILHIWGLHDEGETLVRALFSTGIQAGGVRFVFGKLLLGIVLFSVLLSFTRWLTRKLEFDWLVRAGIEASTRDAVATLFGYVTFVIAAVVALSSAGLDLSKLAIVAGALSVGIGFGLQNIVSNFVSGLILLFERPVRSGDHIQVGATQGVVRKIRIRATEIETADRETVIVPNSDLLSNPLRNRDLRSNWGKVVVSITVAPDSDARKVQKVLMELLRQHHGVFGERKMPGVTPPSVQLVNYSAAGLEFELQATLLDADTKGAIASDLRFAINEAFRREAIELPSSRQEVFLHRAERAEDDDKAPVNESP